MSRVARARRRAGGPPADDASSWAQDVLSNDGSPDADEIGIGLPLPWTLTEPPVAAEGDLEPDRGPIASVAPAGLAPHLAALVRAVFLPPPAGVGARSLLFCAADGQQDSNGVSAAAAELLAAQTAKTLCLVDTSVEPDTVPSRANGKAEALPYRTRRLETAVRQVGRNFWIAASGTALTWDPASAGCREMARRRMSELRARFDYVIVDTPAFVDSGLPTAFASLVEGVVLVVDERATHRSAARNVADALYGVGARLLGIVVTNRTYPIPEALYRRL